MKFKKILSICMMLLLMAFTPTAVFAAPLVVVNDGSNPNIPTAVPVAAYSGTGDKVITGINLPAGYAYKISLTHEGSRNFIVAFYYGDRKDYCANEIGNYSGTAVLMKSSTAGLSNGMLEIKADGAWTAFISTITNTSTKSLQGVGNKVSGSISLSRGNYVVSTAHTGSSNFIVVIYSLGNDRTYYVANEIGSYSGQSVVSIKDNGQYCVEVSADGAWVVDFGVNDTLCVVPDIN
jgi:hypothetical protein